MKYFLVFVLLITRAVAQPPTVLVAGRVMGYVTNPIGDYEGIRLQPTTGDAIALRFPPHAASRVIKVGPVGQRVDAEAILPHRGHERIDPGRGPRGHGRPDQYRLLHLSQSPRGISLNLRDEPPPPPQMGTLVQDEGDVAGTLTDERGHLIGLLIGKTYLLELKPHQSELLQTILKGAQQVGFSGYQRPPAGFVNQTGRAVVRPLSLTIDEKTYAF